MEIRKTILVAVSHDGLAMALWRGLYAHDDDIDVHLVRDARAVAARLEQAHPTVAIVEVEDADEGLATLREVSAHQPAPRVVVVSHDRSQRSDDALLAAGAETVRHAPVGVASVVEAVQAVLAAEEAMTGRLGAIGVLDLVQMLCLTNRSGVLRITSGEGRGGIWIEAGEIVHAAWADVTGMDALARLTMIESGSFRCFFGVPVPHRTITQGWRQALMSAACRADEERRDAEDTPTPQPSADVVLVNVPAQHTQWQTRYQELIEAGLASMRAGDLASARRHWDQAKRLQEAHPDEPADVVSRTGGSALRGLPATA
jgi:CheY-like chemotaxis protein